MPAPTLLLSAALAFATALGFVCVGLLVWERRGRSDTWLGTVSFASFWHSGAIVIFSHGVRSATAWLGLDSMALMVALEEVSTPFYCMAAAALVYYVLFLVTGWSWLAAPVTTVDFDVEGAALGSSAANQRRAAAIKRLQETNKNLRVWFTLPVAPHGLTSEGVALIEQALDCNGDGQLDATERRTARIVLYGQSFGGAAVLKLARDLQERDIPVLLTVQIDAVGRNSDRVPPNVRFAANLFQRDGRLVRGTPHIEAEDPSRTTILTNLQFHYRNKSIDVSSVPWYRRLFQTIHFRMDFDPDVWAVVEGLVREVLQREGVNALSPSRFQPREERP